MNIGIADGACGRTQSRRTSGAADEVADFYKGKTITITAASGVGGGYGVYALLIREHFGKYIPGNPNVIVNYNPGGGGVVAADYSLQRGAERRHGDPRSVAEHADAATRRRVGHPLRRVEVPVDRPGRRDHQRLRGPRQGGEQFDALLARQRGDQSSGVTQAGAPNHILAALMGYCPAVKIRLVSGYKGSPQLALAFQRHEVDGLALPLDSLRLVYPDILKEPMIAQSGLARARDFPDVPLAVELCKDPEKLKVVEFFQVQEEMGRSYAMPPGTPPARVAALRTAFDAVMKDPALLAIAKERRLDINPLSGTEVQSLVERHIATDGATVKIAKQAVGLQ